MSLHQVGGCADPKTQVANIFVKSKSELLAFEKLDGSNWALRQEPHMGVSDCR